jgi:hypothetical protein
MSEFPQYILFGFIFTLLSRARPTPWAPFDIVLILVVIQSVAVEI